MVWRRWLDRMDRRGDGGDFDAEIEAHVRMAVRDRKAAGESEAEAQAGVLREFGNRTAYREDIRAIWGWPTLDLLARDVRLALRLIARSKGLSSTSIVLLATSIALVCASFSVLDAVLVRNLPVRNPDELVLISGAVDFPRVSLTGDVFDYVAAEREFVSHVFGSRDLLLGGTIAGVTGSVQVSAVKGEYFTGFGVDPQVGRFFTPGEESEPAAVISYRFWQDRFGGDPGIIGQSITLGTGVIPIVGVAREGFVGLRFEAPFDVLLPWQVFHDARGQSDAAPTFPVETLARLRPGATAEEYAAQVNALWPSILEATVPSGQTLEAWKERRTETIRMLPINQGVSYLLETNPGLSQAISMTFALAVLIFTAACLTLGLLAIARSIRRRQQTAIQRAIGGTSHQVLRPFMIEHLILSLFGFSMGLVLTFWGSAVGASFVPGDNWEIAPDSTTLGIAALMALIAAAIGSVLMVIVSSDGALPDLIRQGFHIAQPHVRLRGGLLTLQIAMSLVLVSFGIMYVNNLADLARMDVGFDPDNLHVFGLNGLLPTRDLEANYFQTLEGEIGELPGVDAIGFSLGAPPLAYVRDVRIPVTSDDGIEIQAVEQCLFPGTLEALGVPISSGRSPGWTDSGVALVSQNVAAQLFTAGDPVGRTVQTANVPGPLRIIGVTGDVSFNGLRLGSRPILWILCFDRYDPLPSNFAVNIFVRSPRNLADIRPGVTEAVDDIGAQYIYRVESQSAIVDASIQQERALASVSGVFGGLVVALTGVGLYAFSNALLIFRRKELAIRSSLGADARQIASNLLRETIVVFTLGVGFGALLTFAGRRVMSSVVVGLDPVGPSSLVLSLLVVIGMTAVATSLPVLRAIRINLSSALRTD